MLSALMESHDFLALTLANPQQLEQGFSFELGDHTKVSVWDTGVIVFEPNQESGKDIVLSCGVHGNETAPIEICNGLIRDLLAQKLIASERTLFLIGNPPAINTGSREVEENMNRLFSGAHSRGAGPVNRERERAKRLEAYVDRFYQGAKGERQRIHYDLHTAIRASKHEKFAIYPYRPGRAFSGEQIMFLAACGIDTILFHHEPTTTFSYFSSEQYRADAFTIELGKVQPFGQNDMTRFATTIEMLSRLIGGQALGLDAFDAARVNLYQVCRVINKHFDDFQFTFAGDVENFRSFPRGHVLATEGGQEIKVEHESEAIVFPNIKVPVGQRAVIMLIPAVNPNVA